MIKTWHKIKKNPSNHLLGYFFRWWRLGESNISHMALIKGYFGNE